MARFELIRGGSEVVVRARMSPGARTITMVTHDVVGAFDAELTPVGVFLAITRPACRIEVPVHTMHSLNPLLDREGRRRFDAKHYPVITAELVTAIPRGSGLHRVTWRLHFHGEVHDVDGDMAARALTLDTIRLEGEQSFNVRRWGVATGGYLGLHVDPEARFAVKLLARRETASRVSGA